MTSQMRGWIREKKQHDILQQAINLAGIIDDRDEMTVSNINYTNALEATFKICKEKEIEYQETSCASSGTRFLKSVL